MRQSRIELLFLFIPILVVMLSGCSGPAAPTPTSFPRINQEQAIEIATRMLPDRLDSVVARSEIRAELHGWYWEVIFDNINAAYEELTPFPLKPPPRPPTLPEPELPEGIYQSMVVLVDAWTGDLLGAGASRAPRPGPYVSQEQAIASAQRYVAGIPLSDRAWLDTATVEAYLRGDIWCVLFYDVDSLKRNGSTSPPANRIQVTVDAVTGEARGAARM